MTEEAVPVIETGGAVALGELRSVCLDRERSFHDDVVSLKSLRMDANEPGRIQIQRGANAKVETYNMDRHIYRQAPGVLYGLPGSYLHKLVEGDSSNPELAALNFNHWVGVNKDREVLLRFRQGSDGPIIRGLLPASWNPVPYASVIDVLSAKHGKDQTVMVEQFDEMGLCFNFVTAKLDRKKAQKGDDVEWGMRFMDSDVGLRPKLELMPYTMTLWCTNGCTTMGKGASVSISHSTKQSETVEEVMANIRQGMEMITGYSRQIVEQMDRAQEIKLDPEHFEDTLKRVNKRFDITKLEDRHVREAWIQEVERDPTVLRLSNSYTRAANSQELKQESRFKLQGVGGAVLELTDSNYRWN